MTEPAERVVPLNALNLATEIEAMDVEHRVALSKVLLRVFAARGESSEDVLEEAAISLLSLQRGNLDALRTLVAYAQRNMGIVAQACEEFTQDAH